MFCDLGEKSIQDLGRKKGKKGKKKEKKEKRKEKKKNGKIRKKRIKEGTNLIATKSWLVEIKGYHKTYNRAKYFLLHLIRF